MADELTKGALETLSRLRRNGLIAQHHSPENTERCRCVECWGNVLQPTRLRVVTMGPTAEPACDGDAMVCSCPVHAGEREALVSRPRRQIAQPWDVRPSRRMAA